MKPIQNPFQPGPGQFPPYLAGRENEIKRFRQLFEKRGLSNNIVIAGPKGVGKTVLLDRFRAIASEKGWMWCGREMSESTSVSEESLARKIMSDLAVYTSAITIKNKIFPSFESRKGGASQRLGYLELEGIFDEIPGQVSDKLKALLGIVWQVMNRDTQYRGIVFAYDNVQKLQDHAKEGQYPLSVLLDVFQSLQKREIPFLLLIAGLPTLLPKLDEAKADTDKMFERITLNQLSFEESREAILGPMGKLVKSSKGFAQESVETIFKMSHGNPFFIQFICKEVYDIFNQQAQSGVTKFRVPEEEIVRKLDMDYFSGLWTTLRKRQQELLTVISTLESSGSEFTVREIAQQSRKLLDKPFGASQITQIFSLLSERGILFRNRHGRYSFALPLFDQFIKRQTIESRKITS
jgi:hypothetical protein